MKQHISNNLPYQNTIIGIDQTVMDITIMLKQENAKGIRWTDTEESIRGVELPMLEFLMGSLIDGVEKDIIIRVKPRLLTKEVGARNNRRITAAPEQSMRLLYWWLKSKLEAIKYGLESIENVLLSHIVMNLPNGQTSTVGAIVKKQLINPVTADNLLPEFKLLTPEEVEEKNKKPVIDVESEIIDNRKV